jgi:hypothetical protein
MQQETEWRQNGRENRGEVGGNQDQISPYEALDNRQRGILSPHTLVRKGFAIKIKRLRH